MKTSKKSVVPPKPTVKGQKKKLAVRDHKGTSKHPMTKMGGSYNDLKAPVKKYK